MVFVELYSQPVFRVDDLLRHEEVAGPVGFCPWIVVFLLHREGPHEGGCRWDGRDNAVPGWLNLEAASLELARSDLVDADGAETAECIHCDPVSIASWGRIFVRRLVGVGWRDCDEWEVVMRAKSVWGAGPDVHVNVNISGNSSQG